VYTAEEDILFGVTRQVVLELCQQLGIPVHRGPLPLSEIGSFTEAFITSTTRNVQPLTWIQGQVIGTGKLGPVSKRLIEAFDALVGTNTLYPQLLNPQQ